MVDIKGLPKEKVFAALYNNAKPQGLGFLHYDPKPMTYEEAKDILNSENNHYFDYFKGRVMKINISTDEIDERLYDRDNGEGACSRAIEELKAKT